MVMIHEFGHFLTAKFFGMKVTEFFLGFGKRIWSFSRGETEYGVKMIPAGRLRPHHRHEQSRRGRAEKTSPDLSPATLLATHRGCLRRIIHALCDGVFAWPLRSLSSSVFPSRPTKSTASINVQKSPAAEAGHCSRRQDRARQWRCYTRLESDVTDQLSPCAIGVPLHVIVEREVSDSTVAGHAHRPQRGKAE